MQMARHAPGARATQGVNPTVDHRRPSLAQTDGNDGRKNQNDNDR